MRLSGQRKTACISLHAVGITNASVWFEFSVEMRLEKRRDLNFPLQSFADDYSIQFSSLIHIVLRDDPNHRDSSMLVLARRINEVVALPKSLCSGVLKPYAPAISRALRGSTYSRVVSVVGPTGTIDLKNDCFRLKTGTGNQCLQAFTGLCARFAAVQAKIPNPVEVVNNFRCHDSSCGPGQRLFHRVQSI
jgi:hypothetical protein